ncbi:MAG: acetylesterase [Candidatus Reconcilbacillus cellulovorans]|uniref:Acetylesterase n=1 Tax=Candidatus Reconcilbacillus cellulovorans TaxID=1906605 RepID=A0A2A6DZM3_9BACL|nr:MAG: acetylesterase [Candidatus Reconcilbacillus cellulovorans]
MAYLQVNFFSEALDRKTTFHALIPIDHWKGRDVGRNERPAPLKSLYLLCGYSGDEMDWIHYSTVRSLSEQYNVAVFMPEGGNFFYLDDVEKGECFGAFIGKELVEYTRKLFPLSVNREDTWIGGLSMGGYGALRNGLKYAETFGRIIALSSALITYRIAGRNGDTAVDGRDVRYFRRVFGDLDRVLGSDKDPEALVLKLKEAKASLPRIYMACGTEDFLLDVNRRFRDFLMKENVEFVYEEGPGEHSWDFWNKTLKSGLRWALGNSELDG